MKLIVCVKRVPHTAAKLRLSAPEGGGPSRNILTEGIELTSSPYDEIALAEAIRIKEKMGGGEVIAVSVGGNETQIVLRTALAMGADSAIHLRVAAPTGLELDGFQTASILAALLRERPFDLLLFGRLAADDQSSQVGTITARMLGIPSVADAVKVELSDGRARFHHLVEGQLEIVECPLPAAVTAQKGLAEAPYPSIKQIMAAKKKSIETLDAAPPEPAIEILGLETPPRRKPGKIVGEGVKAVPELVRLLKSEAKVL